MQTNNRFATLISFLSTVFILKISLILSLLVTCQPGFASQSFADPHGTYDISTAPCAICHETHAASDPALFTYPNQKALCYGCHDGSNSIYNVKGQFGEMVIGSSVYASFHPIPNGVQACTTCHNPHLNNNTKPQLLEVGASKVSTGNAVCGECHGSGSTVTGGDMLTPFNGTPHDVEVTNPASGTQIKCARCHQPHGSSIKPLLQNSIVSQTGGVYYDVTGNNNTVCSACHNDASGTYSGSTVYNATYHGQKTSSTVATVTYKGTSYAGTLCLNCHEPHGKTGVSLYRRADGNTLCTTCHDDNTVSRPVSYSYRGINKYSVSQHAYAEPVPGSYNYNLGLSGSLAWESYGLAHQAPTPVSPGTAATAGQKGDASTTNARFWSTDGATTEGTYNFQMYKFHVNQDLADIRQLEGTWRGYGEPTTGHPTDLLLWNNTSSVWEPLASGQLGDPNNPGNLSWTVSTGWEKYLNGSNDVYILARALHDGTGPVISGVNVTNGAGTSIILNFSTNETTTANLYYGTLPGLYPNTVVEGTYGTSHAIPVLGLNNDTTYYYKISSYDKLGNRTDYTDQFHTSYAPSTPINLVSPGADPGPGTDVSVPLTWTAAMDLDPTDTVSYEWRSFVNGGSYSSGVTATNSFNLNLGYTDGPATVTWQVRAKDNHGVYSDWSVLSSFPHTGPPSPPPFSCPNLYVWDGNRYAFVTDIAGSDVGKKSSSTGKYTEVLPGLPVGIPWNLLQEENGEYTIKIKSERDEVDFVDNAVLMAIDHPVGTRVAANDLNRGKKPSKIYSYAESLKPVKKATYVNNPVFSGGKPSQPEDVTEVVSKEDKKFIGGTYQDDNQFTFDLGDLKGAKQIKLVMVGWTDFSSEEEKTNALRKRENGVKPAKTYLEILQPDGTWKKETIKHFNGMTKTVVVDLTGKFPEGTKNYKVRFRGMLRPRIDFVGVDTTPQVKFTEQYPELLTADLSYRGVSTTNSKTGELFDYDKLAQEVVLHEGKFTRFGDVLPLLNEVDDKLVAMDSGDEITLKYRALPPPAAGMTRSFILKPWVYYKEGDLAKVEPIPFRKMDMNKLPKSLGEYPAELKATAEQWNTRMHHAGELADPGLFERIKQLLDKVFNWFARIWESMISKLSANATELQLINKTASITRVDEFVANKPQQHYSLNTDFVQLVVRAIDNSVPQGYCGNCHAPHGKDNGSGSPIAKQLQRTPDTVCFGGGVGCHSDAKNSTWGINLADRFTSGSDATSRHSVSPTEQQAKGTKIECTNCHDPHLDTATTRVIDPYNRTTPYNFVNGMVDYVGPEGKIYLMVKSKHDGRPPAITAGPTISSMTDTSCTISWTTDELTTGQVHFGTTSGYGQTVNSINGSNTNHTAYITGMVKGQNYHFQVRSYDPVGNYYFTPDALVDTTPPSIVAPGPNISMSGDSATITWTTNEASTSYVAYSPAELYTVSGYVYLVGNDTNTQSHSVNLTGLTPGAEYHMQVRSMDARGNTVYSDDYTIQSSDSPPPPNLIALPDQLDGTTPKSVTLTWDPSIDPNGDSVSYLAQISPNNTFTYPSSSPWSSDTSWTTTVANVGDYTWYWRVMAKDQWGAASVWSQVYSFVHRGPAPPPDPEVSCPNLYVWNGQRYAFVTDIAGSDVGKRSASTAKYIEIFPGMPVTIPWNLLQEENGQYTIKIKSERDEVDFVDNAVLMAVDHPVGTRIATNDLDRGKKPSKIQAYAENLRPVKKATYVNNPIFSGDKPSQPSDITDIIAKQDNKTTQGSYQDDNQYTFDLGNLNGAKQIRLVMVGATVFSSKEEKTAALRKRDNGAKPAKTYLEILQPDGTWKKESIKHFNGMTKTVFLDLTGKFAEGTKNYQVRLRGMLRPRIDFVGIDTTPEAKFSVQYPEMKSANLTYRGVSTPNAQTGEIFDYDKLAQKVILHDGKFTRYGDVMPLLKEVDDRQVVMDSGDEITLQYRVLPPPEPGMTRSFVLKSWVYYKEHELAKAEPIPFRNMDMNKLPNSLGEYPSAVKETIAQWNTRVHKAGEKPGPSLSEKIKEFFAGLLEALAKLWNSIFAEQSADSGPTKFSYKTKVPDWWQAPTPEEHYSLNTNYVSLMLDNTVTTVVYDAYSPGFAIWESNTEPTPSSPGNDASAHIPEIAADDNSRWRTDNYPTANQDDGQYNYQMFKFTINTPVEKLYSFKTFWKGYGEFSVGYDTSLHVWNFVYSRWDQTNSKVIGVDTGFSIQKYLDTQPYCYKCHAGTLPPGVKLGSITSNLAALYAGDAHGGGSSGSYWGASTIKPPYAGGNPPVACNDCHDTHGSKNVYHLRENLNGVQGNSIPDINNNTNMLNYCKSCHTGTLAQFHQGCLSCHYSAHDCSPPTADDFGMACTGCHSHGGSMPPHGLCHCTLDEYVKTF